MNADVSARKRIIRDNGRIRKIQRDLEADFIGRLVHLNCAKRGTYSRRRYKAGTQFAIYALLAEGGDISVWLSRVDASPPSFELTAWLNEIEFS